MERFIIVLLGATKQLDLSQTTVFLVGIVLNGGYCSSFKVKWVFKEFG
ncbi:MAG: hypothetical protein ACJAZ9_000599 [Neolewinella sp.]|jgi:hypothetical protein